MTGSLKALAFALTAIGTSACLAAASDVSAPRSVVLVVHPSKPDSDINMGLFTARLSAKLSGDALHVILRDMNITESDSAAIRTARERGADGVVAVTVGEIFDSVSRTPSGEYVRYKVTVSFVLADAWSGAIVCEGVSEEFESEPHKRDEGVDSERAEHLSKFLKRAGEECAEKLLQKPELKEWRPTPPPDPRLTLSDVDGAIDKWVSAMKSNGVFRSNYDNEKEGIKRKPIVIVDGLKDLTGGKSPTEDIDYLLCTASESLRNKLIKLGSFDAKDDKEKVAVAKRIIESDTSPLENPELMAALKKHGSPDFYCAGDLRYFKESEKHRYRLRIAVHSLRTGKIVWEDSVDIEKEVGGRP